MISVIINFINNVSGKKFLTIIKLSRFLETSRLPSEKSIQNQGAVPSLEILFVCAGKDLALLPSAIKSAIQATSPHEISRVVVIIPSRDLNQTKDLVDLCDVPIAILSEDDYISSKHFSTLKEVFGIRAGWVVQQLLKVLYVKDSKSAGVLVCDADTLLLRKRLWLNSDGVQILSPSWEYTRSYYKFLNMFNLVDIHPKYTFVSHHMLMQPNFLRNALIFMDWSDLDRIIYDLIQSFDGIDQSPFCIEYELYAQFMMKFNPDKVQLIKWGNIGVSRKDLELPELLSRNFASVSLHDYLN